MVLTGYPPEDLVLRGSFVQASLDALEVLARRLADEGAGEVAVVVGYCGRSERPSPAVGRPAGEPQNAAAVLFRGEVVSRYAKHHLPNYGVFDEFRYFVRGDRLPVVRLHGVDVATVVCEDLWQEGGPMRVACAARPAWSSASTARRTSAARTTCVLRSQPVGPWRRARRWST